MRTLSAFLCCFLLPFSTHRGLSAEPVTAISIVVPNGLEEAEGNSNSPLPFSDLVDFNFYLGPIRYQQVYNASAFSKLPAGGAYLTFMAFRGDCLSREPTTATNLTVYLSTTSAQADALSGTFRENVGLDEVKVFETQRTPFGGRGAPCPSAFSSSGFSLSIPFLYDPAKGNLLLELQNLGVRRPLFQSLSLFDTQLANDEVSRLAARSLEATSAQVMDSEGLITWLEFYTKPKLVATYETNTVVLKWPYRPDPFVLQFKESSVSGTVWKDFVGTVSLVFGGYKVVTIPEAALKPKQFYRLYWNSPQPSLPAPAGPTAVNPADAE